MRKLLPEFLHMDSAGSTSGDWHKVLAGAGTQNIRSQEPFPYFALQLNEGSGGSTSGDWHNWQDMLTAAGTENIRKKKPFPFFHRFPPNLLKNCPKFPTLKENGRPLWSATKRSMTGEQRNLLHQNGLSLLESSRRDSDSSVLANKSRRRGEKNKERNSHWLLGGTRILCSLGLEVGDKVQPMGEEKGDFGLVLGQKVPDWPTLTKKMKEMTLAKPYAENSYLNEFIFICFHFEKKRDKFLNQTNWT